MRDYKLLLIHFFNFLDAVLTLFAVTVFGVEEANPFMAHLLSVSPLAFITAKFFLVTWALEYLNLIQFAAKNWVFAFLLAGFMSLMAWHLLGLFLYIA